MGSRDLLEQVELTPQKGCSLLRDPVALELSMVGLRCCWECVLFLNWAGVN